MNPSKTTTADATATEGITPMAGAMGTSPAVPFIPPRDTPGTIALPDNPSPPALFHVYGFSVQLFSQAPPSQGWTYTPPGGTAITVPPSPTGVSTGKPLGTTVFVIAQNIQVAQAAVMAQFGSDLAIIRGGTPAFVGAYIAGPAVGAAAGFYNVTPGSPIPGEASAPSGQSAQQQTAAQQSAQTSAQHSHSSRLR